MKEFHRILVGLRKRNMQRYLDQADEMTQQLEEFFHVVDETPPKLNQLLLIMSPKSRCLYAGIFALRLAHQFKADLFIMHKGIHAPLIIEQASDLQVNIALDQQVDIFQPDMIEKFVEDHNIDLVIISGALPFAKKLIASLSVPILVTKHPIYSKR
ncbi:MAG: hypothetical protein ACE5R6_14095 [Candidatus Heimdallarchaeota archaeon]